jgi:hypothetical protein
MTAIARVHETPCAAAVRRLPRGVRTPAPLAMFLSSLTLMRE